MKFPFKVEVPTALIDQDELFFGLDPKGNEEPHAIYREPPKEPTVPKKKGFIDTITGLLRKI